MNLLDGSKFLAVTAFVVAFPPIFTSVGRGEGLKLSLALLLLYLIRGTFQLFIDTCYGDGRDKGSRQKDKPTSHQIKETIAFLKQSSRIFVFSEIPSVLLAGYLGLKYIPSWCCPIYERLLWWSCPPLILGEALSAMTVILSAGQVWGEILSEQGMAVQVAVVILCAIGYGLALSVIAGLYLSGRVASVLAASLVATLLTLLVILTILTVVKEHGTITDATLLAIYCTYDLWLISRSTNRGTISLQTSHGLLGGLWDKIWPGGMGGGGGGSAGLGSTGGSIASSPLFVSWRTVQGLLRSTLEMFSVEMMATLLIQMCLFLLLARLYQKAYNASPSEQGTDQSAEFDLAAWCLGALWPAMGRSIMVAIYTYSWLHSISSLSGLPVYLDPVTWRWGNILLCLLIYTWHLTLGAPSDEYKLHFE